MKMVIAIVQDKDSVKLLEELMTKGYRATKLSSSGGFLRSGNTTLLIGVDEEKVSDVIEIIKETCHSREQLVTPMSPVGTTGTESFLPFPVEVVVGGATVFVIDVEEFHKA